MTIDVQPHILIIDDDPGMVRLLSKLLKDIGKIFFTTNSIDAKSLAQQCSPDIILLDIEMPGKNGFEICKQLKHDPDFKDTPILYVTAHNDMEMEARALSTGAIDFIHKPPNPKVVRARVSNYLALKLQTDRLRTLSMVDGLTGVANRRAFDDLLNQEWRRASRNGDSLSLLMVDVDDFKRFNDFYGHQAGDDCLRKVAGKIQQLAKRPGEVVARYGGEEFAVLLPNCSLSDSRDFAEYIRQKIYEMAITHEASTVLPFVTISIGVADSDSIATQSTKSLIGSERYEGSDLCDIEPSRLINQADNALYDAKISGKNRVCYFTAQLQQ